MEAECGAMKNVAKSDKVIIMTLKKLKKAKAFFIVAEFVSFLLSG